MKDAMPQPSDSATSAPFDAFKDLAEKLVQVPKKEVDRKEVAYQREQAKKPRRGPKPQNN
jgi:hypothetical protein